MTEWRRMSTFSRSATSAALRSGRTLKPMMIAFDAEASSTSDSLIAPTPLWMIRILTFSSVSFVSVSAEHLGRTLHVGLDDDRQLLHVAFGDLLLQRLERQARALAAERLFLRLRLTEQRDLTRFGGVGQRLEGVARLRQAAEAEHFDRRRRRRRLDLPAAIVDERADLADDRAGDERVADAKRAVLHEDRRDRTASLVELRFEHRARRVALRVRLQLADAR